MLAAPERVLDHVPQQSRSRRHRDRSTSREIDSRAALQRLAGLIGNRAFSDGVVAPQQARIAAPAPPAFDLLVREIAHTELQRESFAAQPVVSRSAGAALQRAPEADAIEGQAGVGTRQGAAAEAVAAGTAGPSAEQGEVSGNAGADAPAHGTAIDPGRMISGLSSAVTQAWDMWQRTATIVGVNINAVVASGGTLVGPPIGPLILASAPKGTPEEIRLSTAVATAFGITFMSWQTTVSIPALPMYPSFAAFPAPVAPPTPNVPFPLVTLLSAPALMDSLDAQMAAMYGDPTDSAAMAVCNAIGPALARTFHTWLLTTQVTNIMGTGPIPTFAPPYSPVGPVIGGVGTMIPGGLV